jgi:F-type H+-transporting ATPase subunit a
MIEPLAQFKVKVLIPLSLGGFDISFTNVSLFMVILVALSLMLLLYSVRRRSVVPTRLQALAEKTYQFVLSMVEDTLGSAGRAYIPLLFSIFVFILMGNLIGLMPYAYTVTSQIIVNGTLALVVIAVVILTGFMHHGLGFFRVFFPSGVPIFLAPLLIPIEIISFIARPISLSLRLFVNMVAGHCILKIFASFAVMAGGLGVIPFILNIGFIGFEVLVAVVQAYIFTILSCIYLKDVLSLH